MNKFALFLGQARRKNFKRFFLKFKKLLDKFILLKRIIIEHVQFKLFNLISEFQNILPNIGAFLMGKLIGL